MLWMAHRKIHGKPQLNDLTDFVIIEEFDSFKASTVPKGSSFVPVNELLSLYCSMSSLEFFSCTNVWIQLCGSIGSRS